MYEQVLRRVRSAGNEKGIWTRIGYHPAQPLWSVSCEAEERIETATRSDSSHWNDTVLADVTFVDDACFSFEANNPAALVCKASDLLQIVDEVCEAHGLIVNVSDGKTEFTIEMKCEGAQKQFKRLWDESILEEVTVRLWKPTLR